MKTSLEHMRPKFFIIGVNKCGTSSLYRYLVAHPDILPCAKKEPNFFGRRDAGYIESHIDEYFALFPTLEHRGNLRFEWESSDQAGASLPATIEVERKVGKRYITGEASANTFQDVAPSLLHRYLPDVKLILLIRNPVDRAYSHHRMYQRFQLGGHDVGFRVSDFQTDICAEIQAHSRGGCTEYLSLGIYVDKLLEWVSQYGTDQIRVITTERLSDPVEAECVMRELEDYLEISRQDYGDLLLRRFNHAPVSEVDMELRARLSDFYRPHNKRLEEYLGYELNWA